jgi:putative membrane protein
MKKASFVANVVVLFLFATASMLAAAPKNSAPPTGKAFLKTVSDINLAEVDLGRLAEQKASNPAVKAFGARMIEDHSKAQEALLPLAKREHIMLAAKPGAGSAALHKKLDALSAAEFDKVYIETMLAGHKGAIVMLVHEIEHDPNVSIKKFAKGALPIVQDHIRIAENVAGKLGMSGAEGLSVPTKAITAK